MLKKVTYADGSFRYQLFEKEEDTEPFYETFTLDDALNRVKEEKEKEIIKIEVINDEEKEEI